MQPILTIEKPVPGRKNSLLVAGLIALACHLVILGSVKWDVLDDTIAKDKIIVELRLHTRQLADPSQAPQTAEPENEQPVANLPVEGPESSFPPDTPAIKSAPEPSTQHLKPGTSGILLFSRALESIRRQKVMAPGSVKYGHLLERPSAIETLVSVPSTTRRTDPRGFAMTRIDDGFGNITCIQERGDFNEEARGKFRALDRAKNPNLNYAVNPDMCGHLAP